ncbi:MAG TPA: phosphatidylglycerophosphatase A [Flavobacteriales bacterium]|jgi:phosphatidylglycerophosphatase A|nr:phosphatidylglycerophosphatase A [Flavobacteriales bacterium]
MTASRIIASVAGIGYIGRGGGTVAAALAVLLWMLADAHAVPWPLALTALVIITILGTWAAQRVERAWGHDSNRVVVDELAGMGIALIALPGGWIVAGSAFVLFRVLDITKPLGIARMERLPGGWGVMGDDVLAGLYTNLLLQAVVRYGPWSA